VAVAVGVGGCGVPVGDGEGLAVGVALGAGVALARGVARGVGVGGGEVAAGPCRQTTATADSPSTATNDARRIVGRRPRPGSRRAEVTLNPRIRGVVIVPKGTSRPSVDALRHEG
jgi:hypothetical protein